MLNYWANLGSAYNISVLSDEIPSAIGWAKEIKEYLPDDPSPILYREINCFASPTRLSNYISENKQLFDADVLERIEHFIAVVREMQTLVDQNKVEVKGKYTNLESELANKKVASLLNRARRARYLDDNYQPVKRTKPFQLKLIVYGVCEILDIPTRKRYEVFNRQWHLKTGLATIPIPQSKVEEVEAITKLYPEVDFSQLWEIRERLVFTTKSTEHYFRIAFDMLVENGYIDESTPVNSFLAIADFRRPKHFVPVKWKGQILSLGYLIHHAFSDTNDLIWQKTECNFEANGAPVNRHTLCANVNALHRSDRFENFDPVLLEISALMKR